MNMAFIFDIINAVKHELFRYRFIAVFLFMVVTSAVLMYGYNTPKEYTSEATLRAELTSVLQPLLSGQAEMSRSERVAEARELIHSRGMLERVAFDSGVLNGNESDEAKEAIIRGMRNSLRVNISSQNYLRISYTSTDPNRSFRVVSSVIERFTTESAQRQRSESRNAFEFIESQVQTYRRQLETAENALKEFRATNLDGSRGNVQDRVVSLSNDVEDQELLIQQAQTQIRRIREQLAEEPQFIEVTQDLGPVETELDRRVDAANQQLDNLRLQYHDTHPDIVALKDQIEELEQRRETQRASAQPGVSTERMANPVYEDLRLRLSNAETDLATQQNRLVSLERLYEREASRAERLAAREAEESELTRDYNVTRGVYEDMLKRRENARLTMTLDIEGQGVNYRIQEPASYPTRWNGLQMHHYGAAGPVIGFGAVFGLLGALVLFDGRVRSSRMLQSQLPEDVMVLTSVPHYSSTLKDRILRLDVILLGVALVLFLAAYASVLVFSIMGVQLQGLIELIRQYLPI